MPMIQEKRSAQLRQQMLEMRLRRQQAEIRRLEADRKLHKNLFDAIGAAIFILDARHRFLDINKAAAELLGTSSEALRGHTCYTIMHCRDTPPEGCPVAAVLRTHRYATGTMYVESVDRYLWVSCTPVFNEAGEVDKVIHIADDVTDRIRQEEALRRAGKLEAVGVLAGGLAHDFNNLLSVILGNLEMASMDGTAKPRDAYLRAAREATFKSRELTHQLLAFAKGGDPVKKRTALQPIIDDALVRIDTGKGIVPRVELDPDLEKLAVDRLQMGSAIGNILQNAVEAMPTGGELRITARAQDPSEGEQPPPLPVDGGRYVKLTIADQGGGIPEEILPKIFDPYFTTKPAGVRKGLGLGLTLAYAVIKNHGGEVRIESDTTRGTRFTLYLPVGEAPSLPAGKPMAMAASQRILLMDDEAQLRTLVRQMLAHLGYAVETAADGRAAVAAYRRAMDTGHPFGLVILDLTVKSGLGGKETLREIRRLDPEVLAVVSSGYNEDPVMTNPQRFGFAAVLPKPYAIKELTAVLDTVMPTSGAAD